MEAEDIEIPVFAGTINAHDIGTVWHRRESDFQRTKDGRNRMVGDGLILSSRSWGFELGSGHGDRSRK
jgi:hypothetical protein